MKILLSQHTAPNIGDLVSIHLKGAALATTLAIILVASNSALGAPPTPKSCDDPGTDVGERIKCKLGNVLDQQEASSEMINKLAEVPQERKDALMRQTQRGKAAHGRSEGADFKQVVKKKNAQCQVVEILNDMKGDDDGICKGNEDCAEVLGDSIGDDDGICSPKKGAKKEICAEICDSEAVAADADNVDPFRGTEVEEEIDDVVTQYVELNEMLEEDSNMRAAAQILADSNDPCAAVITMRQNSNVQAFAFGAKIGAEAAADVMDKFCNQDAGGFNSASACAVPEVIKGVAIFISDTMSFIDGDIDSQTIDQSYACLAEVNASVGETNDALEDIQTSLDNLQQQVDAVEQQVLRVKALVKTPPGRRPGWND